MRATGDEADSHGNMFHLHFHFHGNEDSCTKTRFEREAKATPRELYFKDTCFPAPRLEWSWMFLYPLIFFCTVRLSADWLLKCGLLWVHWRIQSVQMQMQGGLEWKLLRRCGVYNWGGSNLREVWGRHTHVRFPYLFEKVVYKGFQECWLWKRDHFLFKTAQRLSKCKTEFPWNVTRNRLERLAQS